MNQHLYDAPANRLIATLWQEQVASPTRRAAMAQQLMQFETSLLLSFTNHYRELKSLPRRTRRGLQRQCRRSLAGVALLLAIGAQPALAATINVGSTCTLAKAIISANADISFGRCKPGRGADTIVLRPGSLHLLTSTLPAIRSSITIVGNHSKIIKSDNARDTSVLTVRSGDMTLRQATVTGGTYSGILNYGKLTLIDSTITGNYSPNGGGGINNQYGEVILVNTRVKDNYAKSGGGIYNYRGDLHIRNSTISQNFSDRGGGGISNWYGTADMINATISGNKTSRGGGIESTGSKLTIIESTISGNYAYDEDYSSGGIYAEEHGSTQIRNSKITGNFGGGIYLEQTRMSLTNTTVAENVGDGLGGIDAFVDLANSTVSSNSGDGVTLYGGFLVSNSTISSNAGWGAEIRGSYPHRVSDTTITGNLIGGLRLSGSSGGSLTLERTIITGNASATDSLEVSADYYQVVVASNYNIFGHSGYSGAAGITPGFTDIVPNLPLSSILHTTLSNNGGPTQTHALVADSPAIDAIMNGSCPEPDVDQRGVSRPQDGNADGGVACDIGSFEFTAAPAQAAFCAGLRATIVGTEGDDHIVGTPGRDVIQGLGGDDRLAGIEGDDVICGGNGDDTIYGGPGNDRLLGATGNDRLVGRDGNDILLGYLGRDRLDGGNGRDVCNGGPPAVGDKASGCEIVSNIP